nr:hypothetical protein [Streptomyces sp. 8K308]
MEYFKPHAVRHYYGSRPLCAGVPENDVADWMGHSSTDVLRELPLHLRGRRGARAPGDRHDAQPGGGRPRRIAQRSRPSRMRRTPGAAPEVLASAQVTGRLVASGCPGFPQRDRRGPPGSRRQ